MDSEVPRITADDFARKFNMRSKSLMWFLGAGTSASSGIPTAQDMVWDFKRRLYISQQRVLPKSVADLSNPLVRDRIRSYIEESENSPSEGAPDEYATLFELTYTSQRDRREYIEQIARRGKPSYGYLALATLMKARLSRVVWTTNFDKLLSSACARIYGSTDDLAVVTLDAPDMASTLIDQERWPILVKLHGDFHSERLKNTTDEIREQDNTLRNALSRMCERWGLIVAGYSGRDNSVMDAFSGVFSKRSPFPSGIFWLHYGSSPPLPRVQQLLKDADQRGIEAFLVPIDGFDETLRDLVRLNDEVDIGELDELSGDRKHWTPAPAPTGPRSWPVLRLNALEITNSPPECRIVKCRIGGYAEIRTAMSAAGVGFLFARNRDGVLAFGSDKDIRAALEPYDVRAFGKYPLHATRLRSDLHVQGLIKNALANAISRSQNMEIRNRRTLSFLFPKNPEADHWRGLSSIVGPLHGEVAGHTGLEWHEAVAIRITWAFDRSWMLFEPRIFLAGDADARRLYGAEFVREKTFRRYNRVLNKLIDFWAPLLACQGKEQHALAIDDGIDAKFTVSQITAFSKRIQA